MIDYERATHTERIFELDAMEREILGLVPDRS